jgi:hypothetical protein
MSPYVDFCQDFRHHGVGGQMCSYAVCEFDQRQGPSELICDGCGRILCLLAQWLFMCVYVCMYVCMYVCVVCMYTYIHIYIYKLL